MPRQSPNPGRGARFGSPSPAKSHGKQSGFQQEFSDNSFRSRSSSTGNDSDQNDSHEDEGDYLDSSYTGSPHQQADGKVRSRLGTRTKGSSPGSPENLRRQNIYPELKSLDDSCGDFCTYTIGARKAKQQQEFPLVYPDLRGDEARSKREHRYGSASPEKSIPSKSEQASEKAYETSHIWLVVILLVLLGFIIFSLANSSSPAVGKPSRGGSFANYVSGVDQLKEKFPQQSRRFWQTLKSSAMHVLNATDPDYPVVLLMAAPIQQSHVSACIAEQVVSLYESSVTGRAAHVEKSDISLYKGLSDGEQKEKLDTELKTAFDTRNSKSFLINNVQALAPGAALILHSYCDNDNAPYKNIMILMTLHIPDSLAEKEVFSEDTVELHLRELWSAGLVKDKVDALLSRVANNIVVVAYEKNEQVKKVCP